MNDAMITRAAREGKSRLVDEDVKGLQLRITKGSKSWSLQCRDGVGRVRTFTLGSYPGLGIAKARLEARRLGKRLGVAVILLRTSEKLRRGR